MNGNKHDALVYPAADFVERAMRKLHAAVETVGAVGPHGAEYDFTFVRATEGEVAHIRVTRIIQTNQFGQPASKSLVVRNWARIEFMPFGILRGHVYPRGRVDRSVAVCAPVDLLDLFI